MGRYHAKKTKPLVKRMNEILKSYLQDYADEKPRNKPPQSGFLNMSKIPNQPASREQTASFVDNFYKHFNQK